MRVRPEAPRSVRNIKRIEPNGPWFHSTGMGDQAHERCAELERILPSQDGVPSAGALRIECAALLSWTASLVVQMLAALAAAHERLRHVSTTAASAGADVATWGRM